MRWGGGLLWRVYSEARAEAEFAPGVPFSRAEIEGNRDKNIVRAKQIREYLKPWAEKHKDILRAMRAAPVTDTKAALMVFDTLPAMLEKSSYHLINSNGVRFTWQPFINRRAQLPNQSAARKAETAASMKAVHTLVNQEFKDNHDVIVSRSVNRGTVEVEVWASGRVTVTTDTLEKYGKGYTFLPTSVVEVAPPFDSVR